jgi:sulfite exporter TauE/SafE
MLFPMGAGWAVEAFSLGLSSGPVCLASCAPVLLPVLAAEERPARGAGALLAQFLVGRLGGYLCFASVAWVAGASLRLQPRAQMWAYGVSDLVIAALLAGYAWALRKRSPCEARCPASWARRFANKFRGFASLCLGFASGLAVCPPFVAAGVRAAESASFAGALLFFWWFFLGTSVWFAPSVSLSLLRRFEAVGLAARMALALLAVYYLYVGVAVLGRIYAHG